MFIYTITHVTYLWHHFLYEMFLDQTTTPVLQLTRWCHNSESQDGQKLHKSCVTQNGKQVCCWILHLESTCLKCHPLSCIGLVCKGISQKTKKFICLHLQTGWGGKQLEVNPFALLQTSTGVSWCTDISWCTMKTDETFWSLNVSHNHKRTLKHEQKLSLTLFSSLPAFQVCTRPTSCTWSARTARRCSCWRRGSARRAPPPTTWDDGWSNFEISAIYLDQIGYLFT